MCVAVVDVVAAVVDVVAAVGVVVAVVVGSDFSCLLVAAETTTTTSSSSLLFVANGAAADAVVVVVVDLHLDLSKLMFRACCNFNCDCIGLTPARVAADNDDEAVAAVAAADDDDDEGRIRKDNERLRILRPKNDETFFFWMLALEVGADGVADAVVAVVVVGKVEQVIMMAD